MRAVAEKSVRATAASTTGSGRNLNGLLSRASSAGGGSFRARLSSFAAPHHHHRSPAGSTPASSVPPSATATPSINTPADSARFSSVAQHDASRAHDAGPLWGVSSRIGGGGAVPSCRFSRRGGGGSGGKETAARERNVSFGAEGAPPSTDAPSPPPSPSPPSPPSPPPSPPDGGAASSSSVADDDARRRVAAAMRVQAIQRGNTARLELAARRTAPRQTPSAASEMGVLAQAFGGGGGPSSSAASSSSPPRHGSLQRSISSAGSEISDVSEMSERVLLARTSVLSSLAEYFSAPEHLEGEGRDLATPDIPGTGGSGVPAETCGSLVEASSSSASVVGPLASSSRPDPFPPGPARMSAMLRRSGGPGTTTGTPAAAPAASVVEASERSEGGDTSSVRRRQATVRRLWKRAEIAAEVEAEAARPAQLKRHKTKFETWMLDVAAEVAARGETSSLRKKPLSLHGSKGGDPFPGDGDDGASEATSESSGGGDEKEGPKGHWLAVQCSNVAFAILFVTYPMCSKVIFSYFVCEDFDAPGEDGRSYHSMVKVAVLARPQLATTGSSDCI